MSSAINWFEIPVLDLERAAQFYGILFAHDLKIIETSPGYKMAQLYATPGSTGGALMHGEGYTPSQEGAVLYLNGGDDLQIVLDRVDGAGGQVVMPKTDIAENGFMAFFIDTEGNKVGLHSMG